MNNYPQSGNFQVFPIPENIKILQNFKRWRRTGENLNGAIMIGLLEHFQINSQSEKIQQMINNMQSASDEQIIKMRNILNNSLQYSKGQQQQDYLIDQLKQQDPFNIFPSKFILEYLKRVKGHVSDEAVIPVLKTHFQVNILVINDDYEKKAYTILDPKDRDQIILCNFDRYYYVIQKEPGPQLYKCQFCQKQISEDYHKMKCNQIICYQCLKKFFEKGNSIVQCKEKNCTQSITLKEFQNIQNKQKEMEKSQINQSNIQKTEESQQYYKTYCNKCKNRMSQESLLLPLGCSHSFCKSCLQQCFSLLPSGIVTCIQTSCKGKFIQKDLDSFIKGQSFKPIEPPPTQINKNQTQNMSQYITPLGNQEPVYQCEGCFKDYQQSSIYTSECLHKFCKICCDKEISKNISCFQCYKVNCGYKLKIEDIQKYFYKKIKGKTFGECANCKQECKIFESFQNSCYHLICYSCVKQIYTEGLNPQCRQCKASIISNDLDDYYLPQASQEIQQFETIETNIKPASCTFCNSPFTDYNLQQDIPCSLHTLGSCCVIFPSNCPQCQIGSLIIEKCNLHINFLEKLKFYLLQNTMDRFYFASESSIK